MGVSKLYSEVYKFNFLIKFKNNQLNVDTYKELKTLGIWTIKNGKELILILSDQKLKEEQLRNLISGITGFDDFNLAKRRSPIDYFNFDSINSSEAK